MVRSPSDGLSMCRGGRVEDEDGAARKEEKRRMLGYGLF